MSAPERIWASCDTPDARLKSGRWHQSPYGTMYILATPEALAASPEVQALIAAAETRGWNAAIEAAKRKVRAGKAVFTPGPAFAARDTLCAAADALDALKKGE